MRGDGDIVLVELTVGLPHLTITWVGANWPSIGTHEDALSDIRLHLECVLDAAATVEIAKWAICPVLGSVILDEEVRLLHVCGVIVELGLSKLLSISQVVDKENSIIHVVHI